MSMEFELYRSDLSSREVCPRECRKGESPLPSTKVGRLVRSLDTN